MPVFQLVRLKNQLHIGDSGKPAYTIGFKMFYSASYFFNDASGVDISHFIFKDARFSWNISKWRSILRVKLISYSFLFTVLLNKPLQGQSGDAGLFFIFFYGGKGRMTTEDEMFETPA